MPILKLNKQGIPYETNPNFDGEKGFGRSASLVNDSEVFLDVQTPKNIQRDRAAVANLSAKDKLNKFKKYAFNKAKEEAKEKAKLAAQDKLFLAKQKMYSLESHRNSIDYLKALQQSGHQHEVNSGVMGYGLTSDGRKPFIDQPALDFKPQIPVDVAFGSVPSGYDNSGMGAGAAAANFLTPTEASLPINDPSVKMIEGEYSTKHQYMIETWKNDLLTLPYKLVYSPENIHHKSQVFDGSFKNQINSYNQSYNGVREVAKAASNGWMYSGWHDENGNWVSVKVPFSFGLPMDRPNNPGAKQRDQWRKTKIKGGYQEKSIFDWMRPIIEAFALYYKYMHDKQAVEFQRLTYEVAQQADNQSSAETFKAEQAAAGITINTLRKVYDDVIQKIRRGEMSIKDAKSKGVFSHPMIRQGLIK